MPSLQLSLGFNVADRIILSPSSRADYGIATCLFSPSAHLIHRMRAARNGLIFAFKLLRPTNSIFFIGPNVMLMAVTSENFLHNVVQLYVLANTSRNVIIDLFPINWCNLCYVAIVASKCVMLDVCSRAALLW